MAKNKVIFNGETLIDLTENTVTADTLFAGVVATNAQGEQVTGAYTPPDLSQYYILGIDAGGLYIKEAVE